MNMEKLVAWVKAEGKRRTASVTVGDSSGPDHFQIFVYDYDVAAGVLIDSPDDIDSVDLMKHKMQETERQRLELEKMMEREG